MQVYELQRQRTPTLSRGVILSLGCLFLVGALFPPFVFAQATLENPAPGSFQSGLGIISGWACAAQSIEIVFNDGPPQQAAYGTSRGDTQTACGDTDNGFGLLFNWNLLGDGVHTVQALADGVEFARVTVTVTTFGTEFLREASGTVSVPDWPTPGRTLTLRWQPAQQNFALTDGSAGRGGGTSGAPPHVLEIPVPGSFQSGLGVISGWVCEAQRIEITFDDGPPQEAAYGTSRGDTAQACGDTDNGFGLLFNWNLLGDGLHTVAASADGVEFARVAVTVTTLGREIQRGLSHAVTVPDFPAVGTETVLQWSEAQQNFVITQTTSRPVCAPFLPDANLCRAIVQALGKPLGATVTKAELARLRELDASYQGIVDLTGLEFATNLTRLDLSDNQIVDLTPLAGLTNLTRLRLWWNNEIVDLTPLAGLTNLRSLNLGGNKIVDLTPLAGLTNLTWLQLAANEIVDLTPLAGLTNLTDLRLFFNWEIVDLTPLAGLTNLTWLSLGGSQIVDFTPLAGLTRLTRLDLSDNQIVDLTPLAGLTNLTWLSLGGNQIVDFTPLAGLTRLTELDLSVSAITDLTLLVGLTRLTELDLSASAITDLTPLVGLTRLSSLNLSRTSIRDFTPLADLAHLETLNLYNTGIRDLTPLADLANLETLDLSQTLATDLAPLFGLPKLAALDIDRAPVLREDLDTLAQAGVAIDGSPAVTVTGAVDIHHDNVIVMHLSELPATSEEVDTLAYTRRIYEEFEDAFDFLVFVYNFNDRSGDLPGGWYTPVRNDTQGIGKRLHFGAGYGSQEQLLGVAAIFHPSAIPYVLLHELMHHWANFVVQANARGHWGFSSADGQLGGFPLRDLVHLGGDRYAVQSAFSPYGNEVPYSPIELYFAGLIPPDNVPDLWVAEDGEWLVENGERVLSDDGWPIFTATTIRTLTIDDIIAAHGERVPDWTVSQKDFQAAAVLLVDAAHPATPAHIQEVSDDVAWFSHPGNDDSSLYNFYEATGGRATITMDGLSQFLKDG